MSQADKGEKVRGATEKEQRRVFAGSLLGDWLSWTPLGAPIPLDLPRPLLGHDLEY